TPGTVGGGEFGGEAMRGSFGFGENATFTGLPPKISILGGWISYGDDPSAVTRRLNPWLSLPRNTVTVRGSHARVPLSCGSSVRCRATIRISPGGRAKHVQVSPHRV